MKNIPEYLTGRGTDKFAIYGLIQPNKPRALDLIDDDHDSKLQA